MYQSPAMPADAMQSTYNVYDERHIQGSGLA